MDFAQVVLRAKPDLLVTCAARKPRRKRASDKRVSDEDQQNMVEQLARLRAKVRPPARPPARGVQTRGAESVQSPYVNPTRRWEVAAGPWGVRGGTGVHTV